MRIVLDFETANRAGVDLRVVGADVYAKHPATEILCAVLKFEDGSHFRWRPGQPWQCYPDKLIEWEAHNAAFEKAIWRAIMVPKYGMPDIPDERWHCSQATARYKGLPGGLDKLAKVLELVHQKDMAASRFTKKMSTPNKKTGEFDRSPESLQRVEDYCVTDTDAEAEAIAAIGSLSPYEREVWLLDQTINQRGVLLDAEYIAACIRIVDQVTEQLTAEFVTLTGVNPTQRDKVLRWAQDQGAPISSLNASTLDNLFGSEESEDVGSGLDEDVQTLPNLPQPVLRALQIRRVLGSASIKKLRRMQFCAAPDGRSRGLVEYHGAGTGRWAGRLWQPHNLVRGKVKLPSVDKEGKPTTSPPSPAALKQCLLTGDAEYVRLFFPDPIAAVSSGLRHAVIPTPGCAFHSADFSGIEMRFVLAVAGQHDKCALLASGKDVYLDMACDIYDVPKGTFNKNDHVYERTLGKNTVLGCGFQMWADTFQERYCQDRDIEFAKSVVLAYRKQWAPKVPYVWYELEELALRAVSDTTGRRYEHKDYRISYQRYSYGGRDWLVSILPDGQLMWYYNPQYDPTGGRYNNSPVWTYDTMKLGQWKRVQAYGGLLTENYIQKLARGLLFTAMKLVEKAGYPVVLTVHDEILSERAGGDQKAYEQIMASAGEVEPYRSIGVPVQVEGWTGDCYRK